MDNPKCRICGERHQGLICTKTNIAEGPDVSVKPVKTPETKKAFDRKAYQREYVRKWRQRKARQPSTMVERPYGPSVVGGKLFFRLLDGSSVSCECIAGSAADQIVECCKTNKNT